MDNVDMVYVLLVLSTLVVFYFLFLVVKRKHKKQIHYAVSGITISLLIWNIAVLLYKVFHNVPWILSVCERLYFLGAILVPVCVLFTGMIYARTKIKFTWKHALLLIVPVINIAALFTNDMHHLFYTTFSLIPSEQDFGIFFTIHTVYSYLCIGAGLYYLIVFSIKNYGLFSKQSILIVIGIVISLMTDALSTFKILNWSAAVENIAFAITIIFFILATLKFDFLNVVPIALQTVVNLLSDSYAVINEDFIIIDYNKAFAADFAGAARNIGIMELIQKNDIESDVDKFASILNQAVREQKKINFEMNRFLNDSIFYYSVEVTPIYINGDHMGTIIIKKDITEYKNSLIKVIQLNERLQSLATRDWLTQAYNRYFFDERLQQEIDRLNRLQSYGREPCRGTNNFGLIMFDIDYFKIYNDNNGHVIGDNLLKSIVEVVKEALYPTDILCRYGGEEFTVICSQTSEEGVKIVAEKIRKAVEQYDFPFQDKQPNGSLTISVGAVYCSEPNLKKDDLMKRADNNLYLAKSAGKNMVVCS